MHLHIQKISYVATGVKDIKHVEHFLKTHGDMIYQAAYTEVNLCSKNKMQDVVVYYSSTHLWPR